LNRISGNGYAAQGNNFGIGLVSATDTGNMIEGNEIEGNTNGIFLTAGVQGNTISANVITGNPPVQVAVDHAANTGYDIKNMAAAGANAISGNLCLTSLDTSCPALAAGANLGLAARAGTDPRLERELEASVCGVRLATDSCRAPVSVWNDHLVHGIDSGAKPLAAGNGAEQMTVRQYLQARAAAGIDSALRGEIR
jgi:parallel beta-helix repeat protein